LGNGCISKICGNLWSQCDRRLGSPNKRYPSMILVDRTLPNTSWNNLANFLTLEIGVAAVVRVFHGVAVSDRLDHFWCRCRTNGLASSSRQRAHFYTFFAYIRPLCGYLPTFPLYRKSCFADGSRSKNEGCMVVSQAWKYWGVVQSNQVLYGGNLPNV